MAKGTSLKVLPREISTPVKQIRRSKQIPAVIYGYGMEAQNISLDAYNFTQLFRQAGYTTLVNLTIGDDAKVHPVLIREVQYHPLKGNVLHVDFYQVRLDQKIRADVPLEFTGEASAIKDLGGVLVHPLETLSLEALPSDLPHNIPVDISSLTDFEKAIHVKDLKLPAGLTLFHEPEEVVALVQPPRSEEELAQLEEETKEDVKAVEGVEDKEPVEEAAAGAEGEESKKPAAKEKE